MKAAVAFFFFNKIDTTLVVFDRIKEQRPMKLYLISDGPRDEDERKNVIFLRNAVEKKIDWNPAVELVYSDENLGCKNRIVSGLNYVFEREDRAIIIEDDVLPQKSFFPYCDELLERYCDDERIVMVSGLNVVNEKINKFSYGFSKGANIWGWATWRRVWKQYDSNIDDWKEYRNANRLKYYNELSKKQCMEYTRWFDSVYEQQVDTWDYQFLFLCLKLKGLSIFPMRNLIKNIGFNNTTATHTKGNTPKELQEVFDENVELDFPLVHPAEVRENKKHYEREWAIRHKDEMFFRKTMNAFWRLYHRLTDSKK